MVTPDEIDAAYDEALKILGRMRHLSLYADDRACYATVGCFVDDQATPEQEAEQLQQAEQNAAAERIALADYLWDQANTLRQECLYQLRDVFRNHDQLRRKAYQLIGSCDFGGGDHWVEATIATTGYATDRWAGKLGQVLRNAQCVIIGTETHQQLTELRESCPFNDELDGQIRKRIWAERSALHQQLHSEMQYQLASQQLVPAAAGNSDGTKPLHNLGNEAPQLRNTKNRKRKPLAEVEKTNDEMLLSFLCTWHGYETDEFKSEHVGVREFSKFVAERAEGKTACTRSTVSLFFLIFGGHAAYKRICREHQIETRLAAVKGDLAKRMHLQLDERMHATLDDNELD